MADNLKTDPQLKLMKSVKLTLKYILFIYCFLLSLINSNASLFILRILKDKKPSAPFIKFLILLFILRDIGVSNSLNTWKAFFAYMKNGHLKNLLNLNRIDFPFFDMEENKDFVHELLTTLSFTNGNYAKEMCNYLYGEDIHILKKIIALAENKLRDKVVFKILNIKRLNELADAFEIIMPSDTFNFKEPTVYGSAYIPIERTVDVAQQSIAYLSDVYLTGAFQVIKGNNLVVYDETALTNSNLIAGVWKYFLRMDDNHFLYTQQISLISKYKNGILLSGRATENYYHWLIEYLPRILTITKSKTITMSEIPLVVKSGLPKQFYEALELVAPKNPILEVNPELGPIYFESIIVPSMHSYLPDDFSEPYWKGGSVSVPHLTFLRNKVLASLNLQKTTRKSRIFLKRSGARSLENSDEIEIFLLKKGFQIVKPEILSFVEQVTLFNNSEFIIGAGGAAMSNLIFIQPNTKIICLVSNRNKDFCTQSNLAQITGSHYVHLAGDNTKERSHYYSEDEFVHSPFSINLNDLIKILDQMGI